MLQAPFYYESSPYYDSFLQYCNTATLSDSLSGLNSLESEILDSHTLKQRKMMLGYAYYLVVLAFLVSLGTLAAPWVYSTVYGSFWIDGTSAGFAGVAFLLCIAGLVTGSIAFCKKVEHRLWLSTGIVFISAAICQIISWAYWAANVNCISGWNCYYIGFCLCVGGSFISLLTGILSICAYKKTPAPLDGPYGNYGAGYPPYYNAGQPGYGAPPPGQYGVPPQGQYGVPPQGQYGVPPQQYASPAGPAEVSQPVKEYAPTQA